MSEQRPQDRSGVSTDQPYRDEQATLEVCVHPLAADRHLVTVTGVLDLHTTQRLTDTLQSLIAPSRPVQACWN